MKQTVIALILTFLSLNSFAQTITFLDTLIGLDTLGVGIEVQGATPGDSLYIFLSGPTTATMQPVKLFSGDTTLSYGFGNLISLGRYYYDVVVATDLISPNNYVFEQIQLTTLPDTLNAYGTVTMSPLQYATVDGFGDSTWHTEAHTVVDGNVYLTLEVSRSDNYGAWLLQYCRDCDTPFGYRNSTLDFIVDNVASPTRFAVTAWWGAIFMATDTIELWPPGYVPVDTTTEVAISDMEPALVQVYPNPAKDNITITNAPHNSKVSIYNFLGDVVLTETVSGTKMIAVDQLMVGVYVIAVENGSGVPVHYLRFLKE